MNKLNVGDALSYHNGMAFSTYDADNDLHGNDVNCVILMRSGGGNWYNACFRQNLNGQFNRSGHRFSHMLWHYFVDNDYYHQLKTSVMMFRRTS